MSDVATYEGSPLGYQSMLKGILLILMPLFVPALMLNILFFSFKLSIESTLAGTLAIGAICFVMAYGYYNKVANELQGKEVLILTFRDKRGSVWTDFAVIEEKHPISEAKKRTAPIPSLQEYLGAEIQKASKEGKTVNSALLEQLTKQHKEISEETVINAENVLKGLSSNPTPLLPYEYIMPTFAPFQRLILAQPCAEKDLLEFSLQPILYKGFFVNASASPIDVTKVREITIENERIPIAVPTGCDFYVEHIQTSARAFNVSKDEVDGIVSSYDGFRCIELKQKLVTRDAELSSALESLKDFDRAVDDRSTAKVKAYLKTRKQQRQLPRLFRIKKFWLFLGLIALFILVLWLAKVI